MRAAVTVDAGGRVGVPTLNGLSVKAAFVGSLLVRVAGGTRNVLRRSFMRGALYVCVAIHTSKHAAVDGVFERLGIYVQAYNFAVYFVRQRSIVVAGETFLSRGLRRIFLGRSVERDCS
jgi:hypothetical protein